MPQITVDTSGSLHGLRTVALENEFLRVVILPELGARIFDIIYKPLNVNILWHNPTVLPQKQGLGASYDDVWCGGWDELFPTNEAGQIGDKAFPDHGEIWSSAWNFDVFSTAKEASASLSCRTPISDIQITKAITLRARERKMHVAYSVCNCSATPFPFLWNLHPALAVSEYHRVNFPSMKVHFQPGHPGTPEGVPLESSWPMLETREGPLDLRVVPPREAKRMYFLYGADLPEGWCGLTDSHSRLAYGLAFDRSVFRSCWLFATYGAWRGLTTVVLEPSTGYSRLIETATQEATCPRLTQDRIQTSVVFAIREDIANITSISPDGDIH